MANNGISVSTDALPLIAKFFGLGALGGDTAGAPQPPLQAAENPAPPVPEQSSTPPMQAAGNSPDSLPESQGPTKLHALQKLISGNSDPIPNPTAPMQPNPLPTAPVQPPASEAQDFRPSFKAEHPKLAAFLKGALNFAQNAGPGIGAPTFGQGFATAAEQPFIRQQKQLELAGMDLKNQYAPIQAMLGVRKTQADIGKTEADASKANAEVKGMPAKQALEAAQTEAAFYKSSPEGLVDIRTGKRMGAEETAPLSAQEAAVLGKNEGDRVPIKLKNTANEIAVRGITTVNTEEGVFERNRQTGAMNRLGANPRNVFAPENKIIAAAPDPNNPGAVTFMKAGDAVRAGASAPSSAETGAAKAVVKSAVAGKIGDEINAFNTALQHADLLKKAVIALDNDDQNTLNDLNNRFKNEFGAVGPVTAQVISDAYTREINKMLSSGHITDSEIGAIGKTLNVNRQAKAQSLAALDAYKSLAASKMQMRQQQVERGKKGQANFPSEAPKTIRYKTVNGELVPE